MLHEDHVRHLKRAIGVSSQAREHGNTPFGAILVDPDGRVLLEQENIEITGADCTGHAETALARKASRLYSKDFLSRCSLYTTAEPCAMCTGAIYWSSIGRIVYGIEETQLLQATGNHHQNPTFNLPCREVLARGQKNIEVLGPFPEVAAEVLAVHTGYWK